MPGGQFSVRAPHSCTMGLLGIAKFEIQTLSLPSTTAAHGPGRPPPLKGEPGYGVPSGLSTVTLPLPPFCSDIVLEPIQEVAIQEQRVGLVNRRSMMRIIARRMNAAADRA